MILPDVNLLVYAFRADADEHRAANAWLADALAGDEGVGVHDVVLSGFVRIVTNPRIMREPAPTAAGLDFVDALLAAPATRWLSQGPGVWQRLRELSAQDVGIRGNLVPDALLAALCLTHGARLATRDRGFARFEGLRWFDPLATSLFDSRISDITGT